MGHWELKQLRNRPIWMATLQQWMNDWMYRDFNIWLKSSNTLKGLAYGVYVYDTTERFFKQVHAKVLLFSVPSGAKQHSQVCCLLCLQAGKGWACQTSFSVATQRGLWLEGPVPNKNRWSLNYKAPFHPANIHHIYRLSVRIRLHSFTTGDNTVKICLLFTH